MAAALFADYAHKNQIPGITVQSAGIAAPVGAPAEPNAVAALAEVGLDATGHTATQLTAAHLQKGGWFVCMTATHKAILLQAGVPQDRILVLDIPDPYGGDLQVYRTCRNKLQALLPGLVEQIC